MLAQAMDGDAFGGVMAAGEQVAAGFGGLVPALFAGFPGDEGVAARSGSIQKMMLATTGDDANPPYRAIGTRTMDDAVGKRTGQSLGQISRRHRFGQICNQTDIEAVVMGKTGCRRGSQQTRQHRIVANLGMGIERQMVGDEVHAACQQYRQAFP